jgi:hypothetical protein
MYFIVSFLAGLACKLYDDLSDNPLLVDFKTPVLMEFLKGVHYILFTTISLHNPVFFMLLFVICSVNSLVDPTAWSEPYESSLPYSLGLIYFLVQYDSLPLNVYDVCCIILTLLTIVAEPRMMHKEVSLCKLIVRAYFVCAMLCMIVLPLNSITLKYMFSYSIGYCLCSVFCQYYSLYKHTKTESTLPKKPKRKRFKRVSIQSI